MVRYRLARAGRGSPGTPINLTFSVTNLCQSRCRTCRIWDLYRREPARYREELTLGEIRRIFRTMGHVTVFNVSGGEPFLRKDLPEIVAAACEHLTPGIVHIPTNAIAVGLAQRRTAAILEILEAGSPGTQLTVKPSMDHVGDRHDRIRGVPGNFEKVMDLFGRLKAMQPRHPSLHVELGTVISRWNAADIGEIADFVTRLGVDSYRNEIAEERAEMFNRGRSITPGPAEYRRAVDFFVSRVRANMGKRRGFQRVTQAFRLVYYDLAAAVVEQGRQVIPCYAGISNVHLSAYGEVWPCCTLGDTGSMGNLRDFGYDFRRLWNAPRAAEVRRTIREGRCACPLANQAYSNILLHAPSLLKVFRIIIG